MSQQQYSAKIISIFITGKEAISCSSNNNCVLKGYVVANEFLFWRTQLDKNV
jgi:hypothetical protein